MGQTRWCAIFGLLALLAVSSEASGSSKSSSSFIRSGSRSTGTSYDCVGVKCPSAPNGNACKKARHPCTRLVRFNAIPSRGICCPEFVCVPDNTKKGCDDAKQSSDDQCPSIRPQCPVEHRLVSAKPVNSKDCDRYECHPVGEFLLFLSSLE